MKRSGATMIFFDSSVFRSFSSCIEQSAGCREAGGGVGGGKGMGRVIGRDGGWIGWLEGGRNNTGMNLWMMNTGCVLSFWSATQ